MVRAAAVIAALLVTTSATAQSRDERNWEGLRTAPVETIIPQIEVVDEELEIAVKVSSEPVFRARARGLLGTNSADHFLRAFVDRRTGIVVYQVVFTASYMGDYDRISRATYLSEDGPAAADLTELRNETTNCTRYGCRRFIAVGFQVSRATLEWAAARDFSTDAGAWRFRLVSRDHAGERHTAPVEIAAFLARVDQVRASVPSTGDTSPPPER